MEINFEKYVQALSETVRRAFSLPEVKHIRIRDVVLMRNDALTDGIRWAAEKSWHDVCSDVDLCVCAEGIPAEDRGRYTQWMERFGFGRADCLGRFFVPDNSMWRLVTLAGMRYDFGFKFIDSPSTARFSFPETEARQEETLWPMESAERFWFVQVQALGKLFRRDYLIADHLAHMNLNETLVQQMIVRDQKKGTNHHRYGDGEERIYEKYLSVCPLCTGDDSHDRIAKKLYAAEAAFDELMLHFEPAWEARTPLFTELWQCYALWV